MDNSIKLIIYRARTIFDSIVITPYSVIKYEPKIRETKNKHQTSINVNKDNGSNVIQTNTISLNKKGFNAYLVSAYITLLTNSKVYREAAFKKLLQYVVYKSSNNLIYEIILMKLQMPRKQFLDYKW